MILVTCPHITERLKYSNRCGLGLYGGQPSPGTCARCQHVTEVRTVAPPRPAKVITAIKSIAKTQLLRIDRVDDDTQAARLAICDACPVVVRKNGQPHRCGPMYESWKQQGGSTCGCLLNLKARDRQQECPQGKW
jgi:hypothetical protein